MITRPAKCWEGTVSDSGAGMREGRPGGRAGAARRRECWHKPPARSGSSTQVGGKRAAWLACGYRGREWLQTGMEW